MSKKKPFEHEIDPELLAEIEAWEPQEHDEPEGYYFSNPDPYLKPTPLLLMDDLLHLVFDLPELFHLRIDGRKLRLPGLVLLFQTVTLFAPCGDRQLAILEMRF